jgi:hypothetical protein
VGPCPPPPPPPNVSQPHVTPCDVPPPQTPPPTPHTQVYEGQAIITLERLGWPPAAVATMSGLLGFRVSGAITPNPCV